MHKRQQHSQAAVLVDVNEAARRLSVGRTRVFALIGTGELASVKIANRRLIPVEALDSYARDLIESQSAAS